MAEKRRDKELAELVAGCGGYEPEWFDRDACKSCPRFENCLKMYDADVARLGEKVDDGTDWS